MTSPDAFDVEFTRGRHGWYWAIFAAGTGLLFDFGESRFRLVAKLTLCRSLRRLLRTADADIAFLPIRRPEETA
jgi:hypothetical protein